MRNRSRVTKQLFHEFSRTGTRFLGASASLDEFLLNPKARVYSISVLETSTIPEKKACLNDRCKLEECWLRSQDRRQSRTKNPTKEEKVCAYGVRIKKLFPTQFKLSIYSKENLAFNMAFPEFAHNLWEATKPPILHTDNKPA